MNVSLTPALERFVRRQVAKGTYNNASEVVRDALRQMLLVEDDRRRRIAALNAAIKEGLDSGVHGPLELDDILGAADAAARS